MLNRPIDELTIGLVLLVVLLGYLLLRLKIREAAIREDTLRRSQSVIAGKATEHLAPLLPGFEFDPRDARFLGAPIDLLVFDGMNDDDLREIVFLEIKARGSTLTTRERRIRDAVLARRVSWKEFRVD